ncbi:hypothetical protein NBRC110019_06350 [Neptunitalea chrysea]|uniref:tRNA (Guanine-N1)-methyltransferase n=1 Tax=Neptunitalea chrysea TaxID=1647581 RepID=A0A9W6B387_9FLAO|nr:tRNA (guanine-N1)-methyltransferase [Neptunitalea chrysea]GLB51596.1 hypothetical protein NBRC110019_06350 [Neptunitalea chrysea]
MKTFRLHFLLFLFTCITLTVSAQNDATEKEEPSLESGTLESQFNYVFKKSYKYKSNKVIKIEWFEALKKHTLDSLKSVRKDLITSNENVTSQEAEITTLKSKLADTKITLDETRSEKDSMLLFGMQMSKTGYNMVLWGTIIALMVALLLFIYKFKNSHLVTKEAQDRLSELQEEYDNHRRLALEREQKVRRQLQDELNKRKHGN